MPRNRLSYKTGRTRRTDLPLKKVIIEPSDSLHKLPGRHGSELDGLRKRFAARNIRTVDLGLIAPPIPEIVRSKLSGMTPPQPLTGSEASEVERGLKRKISNWLHSRFQVRFEPDTEILLTTGNTPGVFHSFHAFLDRGDRAYIPNPAFSLYRSSALSAGADVEQYEVTPRTDFLPNLGKLADVSSPRARVILINYPHNPTSATADETFYDRLVRFARKNNLLIISDAVYNTQVWKRYAHPAVLATKNAKYTAIEFFTFSFMYNFPMLKLGFAVGCREFLSPLAKLMGLFNSRPSGYDLQVGNYLMDACDDICNGVGEFIGANRRLLDDGLRKLGWEIQPSHSSPFMWVKLPRRRLSLNFCRMLMKRTGVITLPGVSFGEMGEGYMRMTLSVPEREIEEAISRILEHSRFYQRRYKSNRSETDE